MSASDEIIWKVLQNGSCAFRMKSVTDGKYFCMHRMNVDGLCGSQWCPLSNSEYSTVYEEDGKLYYAERTVERNHMPCEWWEKTEISKDNMDEARQVIMDKMEFRNVKLRTRALEKYQKLVSVLKNIKVLRNDTRVELEQQFKKREKRWNRREVKALSIANLETTIEQELLQRLNSKVYGDMYNDVLEKSEREEEEKKEKEREKIAEREKEYVGKETDLEKISFDVNFDNDIEEIVMNYGMKRPHPSKDRNSKKRKIEKIVETEDVLGEQLEEN